MLSDLLEISPKVIASKGYGQHLAIQFFFTETETIAVSYVGQILYDFRIVFYVQALIFVRCYLAGFPNQISILDENQKIVTVSPKELRSLSEQITDYAKKMRAQTEEDTLEK